MKRFQSSRTAVTVIEVLFAAGIAIFGLIGIASLISVAGKQASQSNAATVSQSLANQWFGDFVVRGFTSSRNWAVFDDRFSPASALRDRFFPFNNSAAYAAGTSIGGTRAAYRQAVCIDPLFFEDPSNLDWLIDTPSRFGTFPTSQAFRPGLFPYYQDNFNPLSDSFSLTPGPGFSTNFPRLLRIGLHNQNSSLETLTASQVRKLFLSFDDQVVFLPDVDDPATEVDERDRSAPASRRLSGGAFAANGEYSWIATLCPRELRRDDIVTPRPPEEHLYTMSLVVFKRRDRGFFLPTASGVENAPQGERIAYVSRPGEPLSPLVTPVNFLGGSGGRVLLSASSNTSSRLSPNDWIMLSKYQPVGGSVVVRWYRVIGVDEKASEFGTYWSRAVSLDGPDWVFDATTQATLVSNVVTVFERVVEVQH